MKTNELRVIVRKTKERKMEDPPKASVIRVRSRPVDPDKIERFEKDKGTGEVVLITGARKSFHTACVCYIIDVALSAAMPSDISCVTPPPSGSD